jgi:hypothetical protein
MRFDRSAGRALVPALLAIVAAGTGSAVAETGSTVAGTGSAVARTDNASAASTLNVHDEGHLHFITSSGSEIIDEGAAKGSFPGTVKVHFDYNGNPAVSAKFTISGRGGSISGQAKARLSNPTSPAPSFRGAFSITGGSGHYAHIHGTGEIFGVFTRRGYALVVQTIGDLHY